MAIIKKPPSSQPRPEKEESAAADQKFTFLPTALAVRNPAASQESLPVSLARWNRLKTRVRSCRRAGRPWATAASIFFGVLLASGVPAIGDLQKPEDHKLTGWILVAAISLLGAVLSGLAHRSIGQQEEDSIESIVADMDEMESEFVVRETK